MKLSQILIALTIMPLSVFAEPAKSATVQSFKNGSKVKCIAYNLAKGTDDPDFLKLDIIYKIPRGQTEALAFFKSEPTLGNYRFSGFCESTLCELSIRDTRTNTVSTTNGTYVKINNNSVQIQVSDYTENNLASLVCQLSKK